MQPLSLIKSLLAERGLRPVHRLGQNFLHDHNLIRRLADAAEIAPGDLILEVGPGTGTLTETLLERGATVVACEIDPNMAAILQRAVGERCPADSDRLTLIKGDCLAGKHAINPVLLDALAARGNRFALVANLPYQIASPLLAQLLIHHFPARAPLRCRGIFVTVQREAAQRITAAPGTRDYGPLAILAALLARANAIADLPPSCFWPEPKVTSRMIAIVPDADAPDLGSRTDFARFLVEGFSQRRKMLRGVFRGREAELEGIDLTRRAEDLTAPEWFDLWRRLHQPPETSSTRIESR